MRNGGGRRVAYGGSSFKRYRNDSLDRVTENINLPEAGFMEASFLGSHRIPPLSIRRNVTRPSLAAGDRQVLLTALIQSNDIKTTKTFTAEEGTRRRHPFGGRFMADGGIGVKRQSRTDHVVTDLYMPEKYRTEARFFGPPSAKTPFH